MRNFVLQYDSSKTTTTDTGQMSTLEMSNIGHGFMFIIHAEGGKNCQSTSLESHTEKLQQTVI